MTNQISTFEPLADYLEPQFGNIYEYNLPNAASFEAQVWTDELRQAIKEYLVHEVTIDDYAAFLDELSFAVPTRSRKDQADFIMAQAEAWEIAHKFHLAAVQAVSTLEELIGELETWPDAGLQDDVGEWLDAHLSQDQLGELAEFASHLELPDHDPLIGWREGWHFTWKLSPSQLLQAWRHVVGPAESDLTDDEWERLVLLLPVLKHTSGSRARPNQQLLSLRRAFDGIRYKFDQHIPWSRVPRRYGAPANLYQRYASYRDRGDFDQMHQALQRNPAAERIVAWLDEMVNSPTGRRATEYEKHP